MEMMGKKNYLLKVMLDKLDDNIDYDVVIKPHRKKRSLNANGYCWVLLEKLAQLFETSKDELYLQMLERYGVFEYMVVKRKYLDSIKQSIVEQKNDMYRTITELGEVEVDGPRGLSKGVQIMCHLGSSNYDTKQMARFIDGIVSECKEVDIETMTPSELARLKEEW